MDSNRNNFSSTSSIFGRQESWNTSAMNIGNQRGTSAVSYRTTREEGGSSDKILSISAMPAYTSQSHEELRSQDYESNTKGVRLPSTVHPGTPANMFSHPTTSNQATSNSPFSPFKSSMFTPTSQSPFSPNANPTTNAPSTNPFSTTTNSFFKQSNPLSPHPQTFVSPNSTTTFPAATSGTNIFSTSSSNIFSSTPAPTTSMSPFSFSSSTNVLSPTPAAPTTFMSPFSVSSSTNVSSPQSHNWFNPRSTTTITHANVTSSPFSQTNPFSTQAQASVTTASTASSGSHFSPQTNPFVNPSQTFITPTSTTTTNPWNASSRNTFSPKTNPFANQPQDLVTPTSTSTSNACNNSPAPAFPTQTNQFANKSKAFVTPTSTTISTYWNNSANPFSLHTSPIFDQSQAPVTPTNTATSTPWNNNAANPFPQQNNPFATKSQAFITPASTATTISLNNSSASPFSLQTNLFATIPPNFTTPTSTTISKSSAKPFSQQTNPFSIKSQPSVTPTSTNTYTPWNNSNTNPFSPGLVFPTQPQAFVTPRNTTTTTPCNHSSVNPFTSSMTSPSIWSTSVTTLGPCTPVPNASQPGQVSATIPNQPANVPSSITTVAEVGSQNINGQQYASSSTLGMVVDPLCLRPQTNIQVEAVTSFRRGISSLPTQVLDDPRPFRMASSYRIRHMSRPISLPAQSSGSKVSFFSDKEDSPCFTAPLPRENPRAWVMNTVHVRDHAHSDTSKKGPCFQMNVNSIEVNDDTFLQEEGSQIEEKLNKANNPSVKKENTANVSALMPKLPPEEYYTEPSIEELEAKERVDSGFCSRVKNFVVGRKDKGSIKFFGETDIRHLDLSAFVQFNEREVIVYSDEKHKPPVGQGLNRPAEITLLNIKCISKETGKQCTDGPLVQKLERKLMKKSTELRAEFVSYNPILAEWKFSVQHF